MESYNQSLWQEAGVTVPFVQDNHSLSQKGCIRGMHFQTYPGQAKLIRVGVGAIFDVVVDIRKESPTFLQWEGVILDGIEHRQLFIPWDLPTDFWF